MLRSVHVKDLAYPCVTRQRGHEASIKLAEYLSVDSVEVDLRDVDLLSMSFLDELIYRNSQSGDKDKLVFLVDDCRGERKLARVADIRSTTVVCKFSSGQVKVITPKSAVAGIASD